MNSNALRSDVFFFLLLSTFSMPSFTTTLEILSYDAKNSGIAEKSVIILGEQQAVLVDAQWRPSDAQRVAGMIRIQAGS